MSIEAELALDSGDCLKPSEHENTTKLSCYESWTRIVDFSPDIIELFVRLLLFVKFHFVSQLTCSYIYIYIYMRGWCPIA